MEDSYHEEKSLHILVTGANSGLGFAICQRLIDEFLATRPSSDTLTLIITTRSTQKAETTLSLLRTHLRNAISRSTNPSQHLSPRITLAYELLDLLSLHSVQDVASRLRARYEKLDAVILNAGVSGTTSMDYLALTWQFLREGTAAMTWPASKISSSGGLAKPQLYSARRNEPALGEVFTANTFGHYMLAQGLMPLLTHGGSAYASEADATSGRIIWISTLDTAASALVLDDMQCLNTSYAYESSKRIIDVLALTARLPSTAPFTESYFSTPPKTSIPTSTLATPAGSSTADSRPRPTMHTAHPGICATNIVPIALILQYLQLLTYYFCRWLGNMWHVVTPYKGATSAVWLALASEDTLRYLEAVGAGDMNSNTRHLADGSRSSASDDSRSRSVGWSKWGSATDFSGAERVERTEVEGWSVAGVPGDASSGGVRRGRRPGAKDLTKEGREDFEMLGREVWRRMEELRRVWEGLLRDDGQA